MQYINDENQAWINVPTTVLDVGIHTMGEGPFTGQGFGTTEAPLLFEWPFDGAGQLLTTDIDGDVVVLDKGTDSQLLRIDTSSHLPSWWTPDFVETIHTTSPVTGDGSMATPVGFNYINTAKGSMIIGQGGGAVASFPRGDPAFHPVLVASDDFFNPDGLRWETMSGNGFSIVGSGFQSIGSGGWAVHWPNASAAGKGALIVGLGSETPGSDVTGLAAGTDGQLLMSLASISTGVLWQTLATNTSMTGNGTTTPFAVDWTKTTATVTPTIVTGASELSLGGNCSSATPLLLNVPVSTDLDMMKYKSSTGKMIRLPIAGGKGALLTKNMTNDDIDWEDPMTGTVIANSASSGIIVTTSNATVTTYATVPVISGNSIGLNCRILAKQVSPGTQAAMFTVNSLAVNNAGTVTISLTSVTPFPAGTTWAATVAVSGTNLLVQVAGAAATNIKWGGYVSYLTQAG